MQILNANASRDVASRPYQTDTVPKPKCKIDELVWQRLRARGIKPAHNCTDSVFMRRVYLDAIGTLPDSLEVRKFVADTSPNKREALVDAVLARPEFAEYWAMKWCDLLRVKAEFPINLWPNAVQAYHHWMRDNIRDNVPYDKFARQMLTASGSNFRVPPVNFYRALQNRTPVAIAQTVALTFMGARAERWPKGRLDGMAVFFSQLDYKHTGEWKEEIVEYNPDMVKGWPKGGKTIFPDGTPVTLSAGGDPREVFADWLVSPKNFWFARNMANRVWYWLLGRGIVHEPDDIRSDNPPVNPELLAYLERELISSRFDLKRLYKLILNSATYQLSAIPAVKSPEAEANFACYAVRRLDAEVLIDAINGITGTDEKYSSPIPEPFTFIPENQRSISLADGSTSSSFLEMFGRPARDTGLMSERINAPTADQRLHMLNSSHIRNKLDRGPKLIALAKVEPNPRKLIEELYLRILSRFPTPDELMTLSEYSRRTTVAKRDVYSDMIWSLVNSTEFQYKH